MSVLPKLASKFNCLVGYSDHSIGHDAATVSASLGGAIIEKHFTIDKNLPGPDQKTSNLPQEFSMLVKAVQKTQLILGFSEKKCQPEEAQMSSISRKSLTLISPLAKDEKLFSVGTLGLSKIGLMMYSVYLFHRKDQFPLY